jgi:hypothetical protein
MINIITNKNSIFIDLMNNKFLNDKDESGVVWVPFDEVDNQTYKQYK